MAARQEGRLKEHEAAVYRSTGSRYTFAEPTSSIIDAAGPIVQGKSPAATQPPQIATWNVVATGRHLSIAQSRPPRPAMFSCRNQAIPSARLDPRTIAGAPAVARDP